MADSNMSASELRQRYHHGGNAQDDELTAAQLRARHGIQGNKSNFSTSQKGGIPIAAIIAVLVVVVAVGAYLALQKNPSV
mmetsp:Transcript_26604/g.26851  ORF Transcript_26604/g.26851 Transcript_26604/m.26851 type:complete len:80 (+) Transcript_26604:109-348(+)|eukprot:CAMPEP_0182428294 /NCGR_PEP_ID=MMETSP1167-20130531/22068_1 /TAXON_ID=2988 /ORGANISM="Mallomonas Sp, Strain CCMP3275" /LENGTH=79 /DNA_ID=CAMNT_0024611093 /DNA_START=90 /DNA_END=329 /DNA_ORIENTATION=+